MDQLSDTPKPPYWAVLFTSVRHQHAVDDGYDEMAARMLALARVQPGCLGVESVRGAGGIGITVSYWDSQTSIRTWKDHPEHLEAQGRAGEWYADYALRICKVVRD